MEKIDLNQFINVSDLIAWNIRHEAAICFKRRIIRAQVSAYGNFLADTIEKALSSVEAIPMNFKKEIIFYQGNLKGLLDSKKYGGRILEMLKKTIENKDNQTKIFTHKNYNDDNLELLTVNRLEKLYEIELEKRKIKAFHDKILKGINPRPLKLKHLKIEKSKISPCTILNRPLFIGLK